MSLLDNFDPDSDAAQDFGIDAKTVGIMDELASGTAFNRAFEGTIGTVKTTVEGVLPAVQGLPATINGVSSEIMNSIQGLDSKITSAIDSMTSFIPHVTSQFDNLASNIDLFSSSQGLKNALSGGTSCSSMHDFFGSITKEGPDLIGSFGEMAGQLTDGISSFTQLGTDLQGAIGSTQTQLVSSIQNEITLATGLGDTAKVTQLQGILSDVQSQFSTGVESLRSDLVDQASSLLTGTNLSSLATQAQAMFDIDLGISQGADLISGLAGDFELGGSSLSDMIAGETSKLTESTDQLVQYGEATAMQSLFGNDKCVQTLLGYVGSDSFLSKLG